MDSIEKTFKEGIKSSKLVSKKQAILRATIHGAIIAVSLINPLPWVLKIILFLFLILIFGMIASSKKFRGKI